MTATPAKPLVDATRAAGGERGSRPYPRGRLPKRSRPRPAPPVAAIRGEHHVDDVVGVE